MVQRIGRVLAAVLVMLMLVAGPAACEGAVVFNPFVSVANAVSKTTKKVAKTSVATVKTVVAVPQKVVTKVGKTITGKK